MLHNDPVTMDHQAEPTRHTEECSPWFGCECSEDRRLMIRLGKVAAMVAAAVMAIFVGFGALACECAGSGGFLVGKGCHVGVYRCLKHTRGWEAQSVVA